jgi:hypothetical protein
MDAGLHGMLVIDLGEGLSLSRQPIFDHAGLSSTNTAVDPRALTVEFNEHINDRGPAAWTTLTTVRVVEGAPWKAKRATNT